MVICGEAKDGAFEGLTYTREDYFRLELKGGGMIIYKNGAQLHSFRLDSSGSMNGYYAMFWCLGNTAIIAIVTCDGGNVADRFGETKADDAASRRCTNWEGSNVKCQMSLRDECLLSVYDSI